MNRAALAQACGALELVLCDVRRLRHDGKNLALSVHTLGEVEHTALQAEAEAGSEVDETLGGGLFGVSQLEDNGIAIAEGLAYLGGVIERRQRDGHDGRNEFLLRWGRLIGLLGAARCLSRGAIFGVTRLLVVVGIVFFDVHRAQPEEILRLINE